jgi:hypothetical protein
MKKLILSVTAVAAMSVPAFAQGIYFADNSGASYDTTINGAINTTADLNLELLYGASAGSVSTPIVTLLLSSSATPPASPVAVGGTYSAANDVSFLGTILEQTGAAFTVPAAGTGYFEVLAWTGSAQTYAGAVASGTAATGSSSIFTETIASGATAFPGDISNVGVVALTVVPEPSTLAMAGVGLASMLIFRRKNS